MNLVTISGNIGSDPEFKFTNNGQCVLKMRVGTSERFKNGDNWEERTEWHNAVVWGKRAESLSKIIAKGFFVVVQGSLRTRSWEAKDGSKRYATEIVAKDVEFKRPGGGRGQRQEAKQESFGGKSEDEEFGTALDGEDPGW